MMRQAFLCKCIRAGDGQGSPRRERGRVARWARGIAACVACLALGTTWASRAAAAPDFVESGRAPELERAVLAKTPDGPINAWDLLLFDQMTDEALGSVPMEALLDPKLLASERYQKAIREAIERMAVAQALAKRAGEWTPPKDALRVMSYPAAEAAWLEKKVAPKVKVEDADVNWYYLEHAGDYMRRRQAQARYIYKNVDVKDPQAMGRTRALLEDLANKTRQGKLDFTEAARLHSDARSGVEGGLLPPFYEGTYFPAFEQQAFGLDRPGQISQVFEGPGGLYVMQLARSFPTRNITVDEVRDEIRGKLAHEHVKYYYDWAYGKLKDDGYARDFSHWWPYLNPDAPVAIAGTVRLKRQDFLRFFGNPTDDRNYSVRWSMVRDGIGAWTEGELVSQELAKDKRRAPHRWETRARELATTALRARRALAMAVPPSAYAEGAGTSRTLTRGDAVQRHLRNYRLAKFSLSPSVLPGAGVVARRQATQSIKAIEDEMRAGTLRTEPTAVDLNAWRLAARRQDEKALRAAVGDLNRSIAASPWPGVQFGVTVLNWVSPLPDDPLSQLLADVREGEFSRTQAVGSSDSLYFVLEARPFDVKQWANRPDVLRALAFRAEEENAKDAELARLVASNAIQYRF
jgi:hypothetical protein